MGAGHSSRRRQQAQAQAQAQQVVQVQANGGGYPGAAAQYNVQVSPWQETETRKRRAFLTGVEVRVAHNRRARVRSVRSVV